MTRRGFTIVEVIITLAIITILTMLAIVSLRGTQISARDDERATKARTIANGLEAHYQYGYTHPSDPSLSRPAGQYPSVADLTSAIGNNHLEGWLTGVELSTLHFTWQKDSQTTLVPYVNTANLLGNGDIADVTQKASQTNDLPWKILYEPLQQTSTAFGGDNDRWQACDGTDPCTRYNLYYIKEATAELVTIRSKQG